MLGTGTTEHNLGLAGLILIIAVEIRTWAISISLAASSDRRLTIDAAIIYTKARFYITLHIARAGSR